MVHNYFIEYNRDITFHAGNAQISRRFMYFTIRSARVPSLQRSPPGEVWSLLHTERGNEVQLQTCCNISVKKCAILNMSFQYGLSIEYIGLILNHLFLFFSVINIWFTSILCSIPCTSNNWYKTIYLLRSRILTVIAYDHTLVDTLQMHRYW